MPQLDFYTFSNQQLFTLMCLLTLYYYNLVFFFPKRVSVNNFTSELQLIQIVDLNCTYLYLKAIADFLIFFQKNLLKLFDNKNMFSSIITNNIFFVSSSILILNTTKKNFYMTKTIGIFVIMATMVFFYLAPTPEFLIFWFLIKLIGFLFLISKILFLDLIKFEFNNLFLSLKTNEVTFVFFLKKFLQNLFFVKKNTLNNIRYNIKNGKMLVEFLFECLSFATVTWTSSTKFILFDKMDLKNQEEISIFDDLKPFVWHLPMFIVCFYIIPFVFGWFFAFEGNIFFQSAMSCQMEGIVSLYNYIMAYLTAILFFVTTILFIIVSCGIDGNFYFEIFANNAKLFKFLKSNKKITKKLQKKLLIQWYIPLFHSMKKWNHSTTLELAWTIIPTIILLLIAVPSFILLYALDEVVDTQCVVKIIAHQWYWEYEYPIVIGNAEDDIHYCTNVSYSSFMVSPEEYEQFSKIIVSLQESVEQDKIIIEPFSDDFKTDYMLEVLSIVDPTDINGIEKRMPMLLDAWEFFSLLNKEIDLIEPISEDFKVDYLLKISSITDPTDINEIEEKITMLFDLCEFCGLLNKEIDLIESVSEDFKVDYLLKISSITDPTDINEIEEKITMLFDLFEFCSLLNKEIDLIEPISEDFKVNYLLKISSITDPTDINEIEEKITMLFDLCEFCGLLNKEIDLIEPISEDFKVDYLLKISSITDPTDINEIEEKITMLFDLFEFCSLLNKEIDLIEPISEDFKVNYLLKISSITDPTDINEIEEKITMLFDLCEFCGLLNKEIDLIEPISEDFKVDYLLKISSITDPTDINEIEEKITMLFDLCEFCGLLNKEIDLIEPISEDFKVDYLLKISSITDPTDINEIEEKITMLFDLFEFCSLLNKEIDLIEPISEDFKVDYLLKISSITDPTDINEIEEKITMLFDLCEFCGLLNKEIDLIEPISEDFKVDYLLKISSITDPTDINEIEEKITMLFDLFEFCSLLNKEIDLIEPISEDFKVDYLLKISSITDPTDINEIEEKITMLFDLREFCGLLNKEIDLIEPISEDFKVDYLLKISSITDPTDINEIEEKITMLFDLCEFCGLIESVSEDFKVDYLLKISSITDPTDINEIEEKITMLFDLREFCNLLDKKIDLNENVATLPINELPQASVKFNIPEAFWLLVVDAPLVLPHSTNVWLVVTSADVLHCFAIPALGLKIDAVSGWLNQISLYAYGPGVYHGQCSELCGVKHGFMPIEIFIIDWVAFQTFLLKLFVSEKILKDSFLLDLITKDLVEYLWNPEMPGSSNIFNKLFSELNPIILSENLTKLEPIVDQTQENLILNLENKVPILESDTPAVSEKLEDKGVSVAVETPAVSEKLEDKGVSVAVETPAVSEKLEDKGVSVAVETPAVSEKLEDKGVSVAVETPAVSEKLEDKGVSVAVETPAVSEKLEDKGVSVAVETPAVSEKLEDKNLTKE